MRNLRRQNGAVLAPITLSAAFPFTSYILLLLSVNFVFSLPNGDNFYKTNLTDTTIENIPNFNTKNDNVSLSQKQLPQIHLPSTVYFIFIFINLFFRLLNKNLSQKIRRRFCQEFELSQ